MRLPIPAIINRGAVALNRSTTATLPGLQGSAVPGSTGGTVANGTTYREVVPVAGHATVRIRLLTVTSTGTLTVTPIRPVGSVPSDDQMDASGFIDTTKVVKYTNGGVSKTVAAATESVIDVNLCGENYVLVEFACTATGSITYCDVSQIDYAAIAQGVAVGTTAPAAATATAVLVYDDQSGMFNPQRSNVSIVQLTTASRTTTQTSGDLVTYNWSRLTVVLDMTAVGTGSVTLTINGKDVASGKYYPILAGAAVITNVTNVYRVFPGATAAANATANDMLPRIIQLVVTANNANAATYTLGYSLSV